MHYQYAPYRARVNSLTFTVVIGNFGTISFLTSGRGSSADRNDGKFDQRSKKRKTKDEKRDEKLEHQTRLNSARKIWDLCRYRLLGHMYSIVRSPSYSLGTYPWTRIEHFIDRDNGTGETIWRRGIHVEDARRRKWTIRGKTRKRYGGGVVVPTVMIVARNWRFTIGFSPPRRL